MFPPLRCCQRHLINAEAGLLASPVVQKYHPTAIETPISYTDFGVAIVKTPKANRFSNTDSLQQHRQAIQACKRASRSLLRLRVFHALQTLTALKQPSIRPVRAWNSSRWSSTHVQPHVSREGFLLFPVIWIAFVFTSDNCLNHKSGPPTISMAVCFVLHCIAERRAELCRPRHEKRCRENTHSF